MAARRDPITAEDLRTANLQHDDAIEWPNGEGFTPCTREYAEIIDKRDALKPDWVNLDDLSPEDYEEWNVLDNRLMTMQATGHLGRSARYAEAA